MTKVRPPVPTDQLIRRLQRLVKALAYEAEVCRAAGRPKDVVRVRAEATTVALAARRLQDFLDNTP